MNLQLITKPFAFKLSRPLHTFQAVIHQREGWLLRLSDTSGGLGWGEVSPLSLTEKRICEKIFNELGTFISRDQLESYLSLWPASLAFGVGAALAEIDGLVGLKSQTGWLEAPRSALLLPNGDALFPAIDSLLESIHLNSCPTTLKWKVAISHSQKELRILQRILNNLPDNYTLRIDANGGWDRKTARIWCEHIVDEPRIQWLEQPLRADDFSGLWELGKLFPIALDESLLLDRSLIIRWPGWQVRRPILEGDPRVLLAQLEKGLGHVMISTGFETGIGRRWVNHLAALQQNGPTPTAPGLAPGWFPKGSLFSFDPEVVWRAA